MSLEVIYVVRHGFRSNWVVDPKTGTYHSSIPTPTGIPSDPALAGHGVTQSKELAAYLSTVSPPIERFYSSPFYRCIQTISPTVDALSSIAKHDLDKLQIRAENGIGEWYGTARFDHPSPAEPDHLKRLFGSKFNEAYKPVIKPSVNGESIEALHDRTAYAFHKIIEKSDEEGVKAIAVCTHAATLIAAGRALTGRMPLDVEEEDFRPFTCGLTTFVRRKKELEGQVKEWSGHDGDIPRVDWKNGKGVGGGWEVVVNGECTFLSGGEERGWRFSGDESFDTAVTGKEDAPGLDAGSGLGVVIEGKQPAQRLSPSRL